MTTEVVPHEVLFAVPATNLERSETCVFIGEAIELALFIEQVAFVVIGGLNWLDGYSSDSPGAKNTGLKQLVAGGGIILIGITLPFSFLYSTVTWVLPSGRNQGKIPFFLTSVNFIDNLIAIKCEKGNNSSVSLVA